ncbi:MAG: hypothetical protein DRQ78_12900 [Epsilonproteobacteria bacterium]|nr:MAG: hypothetical protein DRQ78_12900 [Campylobacterota bacterium]
MNTVEMFVDEMMNRVTNIGSPTNDGAAVGNIVNDTLTFAPNNDGVLGGHTGNAAFDDIATMDVGGVTFGGGVDGLPTNAMEGQVFYNQEDGHSWIRMSNDDASTVEEPQMAFDDPVEETDDLIEDNVSLEALNIKLYEALEFAFGFDTSGNLEMSMKTHNNFMELWE